MNDIPHSPGNLATPEQMRNAMIEADQTVRVPEVRGRSLPDLRTASEQFHVAQGPEHHPVANPHGNGGQGHATSGTEDHRG
jgi:hypothetical protein